MLSGSLEVLRRRADVSGSAPVPAPRRERVLDVTVVLLEDGYASTAIGPIEVFHSAGVLWNRIRGDSVEPRFRVRIASVDGGGVTGAGSVQLSPQCSIHDIERSDIVILASSGLEIHGYVARHAPLIAWLRSRYERGAYIAAICTGVAFLAASGLLDGRRATTHWALSDDLSRRYPDVNWRPDLFVTEDGRILTGGGVYSAIDLSLHLVEKFCGHEIAVQCAKSLLVGMPRRHQSAYAVPSLSRPHADAKIRDAELHLQENFDRDVSIDGLARRISMSPRNFIRRFKAATGRLPGAYVQLLRVAEAKRLLESGRTPIQRVASCSGYEDVAFFRSIFKRHTGMTPGEYRNRFARSCAEEAEPILAQID